MKQRDEHQEDPALGRYLQEALSSTPGSPRELDAGILAAARETAAGIRERGKFRYGWALAASFLAGAILTGATLPWLLERMHHEPLYITIGTDTRGEESGSRRVAVETADPQAWYDHIEQLIYNGELEEAERHLRRFNELHPGFRPAP